MKTTPRPLVQMKVGSYAKAPKTEAELAALKLGDAARGLSNDTFDSDPDVIRAAADCDAWRTRLERLVTYPAKSTVIAKLTAGLEAELAEAREAYRFSCLDDFLTGAHDFADAIAAKQRVTLLESRLHAAKTAKADADLSPPELDALKELRDRAEAKFKNLLFALKRKTVLQKNTTETELQ